MKYEILAQEKTSKSRQDDQLFEDFGVQEAEHLLSYIFPILPQDS